MSISAASRRRARLGMAMLGVAGAFALAAPAAADEGFRVSQTCAGCHGTNGASPGDTIPILGGQSAAYLADSLRAKCILEPDAVLPRFSELLAQNDRRGL